MAGEQPYVQGQETDEKLIVAEMICNRGSEHWEQCLEFVIVSVSLMAGNLTDKDDIVQDVMYRVVRSLPHFHFNSALKTWLYTVIKNCINDRLRVAPRHKLLYGNPLPSTSGEQADESENTGVEELSAEKVFEIDEVMRLGFQALNDYIRTHASKERNRTIIEAVIQDGETYVEAAKRAGCYAPLAGYVVREAQQFARERKSAYEATGENEKSEGK